MKLIRSRKARHLNGGVASAASASTKKVPNRPRDSTAPMVHPPRASKGSSAGASGRSGRRAAVDSQGSEREILGVQVVLQVEDARKSRSVPQRVVPGAVVALVPQKVIDAALPRGPARATGREQSQQRPGGLARQRLADTRERVVLVALAGLAP